MDGLKLAAPAALAGAIFGEWYGAERGLGVLLIGAMQSGRAERLWAASLISAACGLLAFALFAGLRRLLVGRFGGSILRSDEPRAPPAPHQRADRAADGGRARRRDGHGLVGVDRAGRRLAAGRAPTRSGVGRPDAVRRGTTSSATGATLLTAAIALVPRRRRSGPPRRRRLAQPDAGRRGGADHRRARRHAARGAAPAVRPDLRLRAVDRALPGGGDGVLPRVRLHPLAAWPPRRRRSSTPSTPWAPRPTAGSGC